MLFICITQGIIKVIMWIIFLKSVKLDLLVGIFANTHFAPRHLKELQNRAVYEDDKVNVVQGL